MNNESLIRDPGLAPEGEQKIAWVKEHMPLLKVLYRELSAAKPLAGKRVVMCLHLEAKTAYLARLIQAAGAQVVVVASNPLSTQDDVVAALVAGGVRAYAWYGATDTEYDQHLRLALDFHPHLIIDDGGDLVGTLHQERPGQLAEVVGGCEETTTGLLRLRSMEAEGTLAFPMIAVNDALMKYLFDNRYGTGQSVWDAIMRTTNLVVAGKTVVVVGYGWCGKGVALRAKGLGARVVITEIDPIKANEALMDGFRVMPMIEAAREGDYFVTVTGNCNVIRREHLLVMKDRAILANAGHFDVEISKPDLVAVSVGRQLVRRNIEEFRLEDGRRLYLLAEGRLVNLAAGDGHPAEIMDLSFALQAMSLCYLNAEGKKLQGKVYPVPAEIDEKVARLRLDALGIGIDGLTAEQERYLDGWRA